MKWWHKLSYWKKGALIGFLTGAVFVFILLRMYENFVSIRPLADIVLIYYMFVGAIGGLGIIASIFGNASVITQIAVFIYGGFPTAIIGGIIGFFYKRMKNAK